MDKTDVILCQLLMSNSRLSYRELAEKLNLSVTAVHNRIQTLIEMGIIRKFTAKINIFLQGAIHVLIFGNSKNSSIRELIPKLSENECVYWVAVAGGNALYIGIYLRHISELEAAVRFVKETAEIPEPTVGLTFSPIPPFLKNLKIETTTLCELDYKIIRSLRNNSRKATSEIAEEVGVSAKTVSHRLARMVKNYLILFSIDWYPDASNDIISVFHVQLKPDAKPNTADYILQKNYPETLFYWGFSNIPNAYLFMVWTPTSKELRLLRESLEQEQSILSVAPNVIYSGHVLDSWWDKIP